VRQETEDTQTAHQGLNPWVAEFEGRCALVVDHRGGVDPLEHLLSDVAVCARSLHVEKTSVGRKADLSQLGEIMEQPADTEVAGVVNGGLGPKGTPFLVVLLDLGMLVVNVDRWRYSLRDDPGAKAPGSAFDDSAAKDERHLVGTTEIEVVADDFLEEDPSGERAIQDLGEGERCLEDREVIAVATSPAIRPGEGMGKDSKPLSGEAVDLGGVEAITDGLEAPGLFAGSEPIVE
jgi:hypothetical protein